MTKRKPRVVTADDDEAGRTVLLALLQGEGYEALAAADGDEALALVRSAVPDLVLLDIEMPGRSGLEVVKELKADPLTRPIPVIMVTGMGERASRLRALENGAEDYLLKPVDPLELKMRVRNQLRLKEYADLQADLNRVLEERVREKTAELQDSNRQTIVLLTSAAEYRDEDTGSHVRRISHYASALAHVMGMDDDFIDTIFYASPMHDIGKIGIPDGILLKPGPLTPAEWEIMRSHTTLGNGILSGGTSSYIQMGARIALTHHECWDGSGYPSGLRGEDIPLPGRIMIVCDQYDALRSRRPYKPALEHETAVRIITQGDGRTRPTQFCPAVLEAFVSGEKRFQEIFARNE